MNVCQAIESLENAKYNLDNIKKLGPVMIDVVREQIDAAIKELEKDDEVKP